MKIYIYTTILFNMLLVCGQTMAQTPNMPDTTYSKETFGTGNSKSALPAGRTTYAYNENSSLNDGDYILYKRTNGRPEWHNSTDHTGDQNGKCMVINAGYTPSEFYRDTVYGLTSSTICSVSLYVMNTNTLGTCGSGALLPKLQTIVEYLAPGTSSYTTLTTFSTPFIPQSANPTWVLTGGSFFVPAGINSVRYRIINNSTGGCGNDLAIDDITFARASTFPLPLTGLQVSASLSGNNVSVNWETLTESNTGSFIIERSADGTNWQSLGTMAAAGNSNSKRNYHFTDNKPLQLNFYRIREIDLDGRITYSNVVRLNLPQSMLTTKIYPNPFVNQLQLDMNSDKTQRVYIAVTDAGGRKLLTREWNLVKGMNSLVMSEVQKLLPGIYFIKVFTKEGNTIINTTLTKSL